MKSTTHIFGCIADPIDHVKAPTLFSKVFLQKKINAIMIPIHVNEKNLGKVISSLKKIKNFKGLTVTIPHKVNVLKYCDELENTAEQTGAVNWIKFNNNKVIGNNFDGIGFVRGLLNKNYIINDKKVSIFGAGGAGMAISYAFQSYDLKELKIINRDQIKLEKLIKRLKNYFPKTTLVGENYLSYDISKSDIIINATSIGMKNDIKAPFKVSETKQNSLIAEIIMEPELTILLKEAKKLNKKIHFGKYMLESQIDLVGEYFNLW